MIRLEKQLVDRAYQSLFVAPVGAEVVAPILVVCRSHVGEDVGAPTSVHRLLRLTAILLVLPFGWSAQDRP